MIKPKPHKKAQILVLTLIVLMILAIATIGVLIILNRDVSQVAGNQKYEQLLNASEVKLNELIQSYGDNSVTLAQVVSGNAGTCTGPTNGVNTQTIDCNYSQTDFNGGVLESEVQITDNKIINGYELSKDESLTLELNNYRQDIEISWTNNFAMDFMLVARNGTNYVTFTDMYDKFAVFDASGSADPITDAQNYHDFQYLSGNNNQVRFRVSGTNGLLLTSVTVKLIITPRNKTSNQTTLVTVTPITPGAFPYQIREFVSKGLDSNDSSTPVAKVKAQVMLTPQTDPIFNYTLLTQNQIAL